ncbi:MAG: hypothetical protein L6V95_06135 [Candidatus Melainabacteria bacterium]|nr:MAG: hypothetical protein L6V95_06135 [Candidatus Melainabacteria bacterium]
MVVPIKTGYFARIKGDLIIKDSQVSDINIYSQGENMSVYVNGSYNYINMDAKMNVYGKLSPSAVSLLGSNRQCFNKFIIFNNWQRNKL